MYRVITQYNEPGKTPIVEKSPWHTSKEIADYWATLLRKLGYIVKIESNNPEEESNNKKQADADLAAALANMA